MVFANTHTGKALRTKVIPEIISQVKRERMEGKIKDTVQFFHLEKQLLRPRTGYNIFCEENKNKVSQIEGMKYRGISKALGELWKNAKISGEAEVYEAQAAFEKNAWRRMKSAGIQPTVYKPVVVEKNNSHLKPTSELKQPRSAYNYYCASRMDELLNDEAAIMFGIGKALGSGWRKLSKREKAIYEKMAEEGREEFYKVHGCYKRV